MLTKKIPSEFRNMRQSENGNRHVELVASMESCVENVSSSFFLNTILAKKTKEAVSSYEYILWTHQLTGNS